MCFGACPAAEPTFSQLEVASTRLGIILQDKAELMVPLNRASEARSSWDVLGGAFVTCWMSHHPTVLSG